MAEATSISSILISLGLDDANMVAGLKRSSQKTKDWSSDMTKILSKAGRDQLSEVLAQRKLIDGLSTTAWQEKYVADTAKLQSKYLENQRSVWKTFLAESKVLADNQLAIERQKTEGLVALDKQASETRMLLLREDIQRRSAAAQEELSIMKELTAERDNLYNATRRTTVEPSTGMSASEAAALREGITSRYAQEAAAALKSEQETNRELGKQISARLTIRTIRMQQQGAINDRNEALQREVESSAAASVVKRMLSSAQEANDPMLKLMQRLKKEAIEFKSLLDKASFSPELRKEYIEQFLAAQKLTVEEYKLQDIRQEGQALLRSLMTAQEAHTARVARYTEMLDLAIINEKEFNLAVEDSKRRMDSGVSGYGRMTGALTQASFAAEDFIQVLSMGGGLNMALMSASNNLSMVARAVIPATSALSAMASAAIPILLIGLGSAITYFMKTKDAVDELSNALKEIDDRFKNFGQMGDLRLAIQFNREDLQRITDQNALEEHRLALMREQSVVIAELDKQDVIREAKNKAAMESMLGGEEALAEMRDILERNILYGNEEQRMRAQGTKDLLDAAMAAAVEGKGITALEKLKELYDSLPSGLESFIVGANYSGPLSDPALINALDELFGGGMLGTEVDIKRMQELLDALVDPTVEMTDEQRKHLEIVQEILDIQVRELELAKEQQNLTDQSALILKNKQEALLFDMKASDVDKERLELQRQLNEYLGMGQEFTGPLSAEQEQASIEFLNAYATNLEKNLQDMQAAAFPQAQGNLEQDAFKAQAQAFDEVMKAASKKPDPQIEKTNKKLEEIREAIANGGVFRIVQQ